MNDFAELSKRLGLLDIATLEKYPESRRPRRKQITEIHYKKAYKDKLQEKFPFENIIWTEEPYSKFSILKENPPKRLIETPEEKLEFSLDGTSVTNWETFIDSFRRLRNNLVHGAKFLHDVKLEDRDNELIKAGLAFIDFLEGNGDEGGPFIQLQ